MAHQQSDTGHAVATAQRREVGIQLDQAGVDEVHPPVRHDALCQQRVEDVPVENKQAPDLTGQPKGVVQGGMVVGTQVAAEPHQGTVNSRGHGIECVASSADPKAQLAPRIPPCPPVPSTSPTSF